jgi:protein-S-isoprenylcysteine O-methyltransferase Ste14
VTAPELVCLLGYASLVVELLVLAVPSVAATSRLWATTEGSVAARSLRLGLPVAICIAAFAVPPLAIVWPALATLLFTLEGPQASQAAWCGAVLVVAGRGLTLAATAELRRSARQARLATRGVFAWSRHPGLVGMFVFYLGCGLIVPSPLVLAGLLFYAAHMHGKVLLEEAHLEREWGGSYRDYAARVARYLTV